MSTNGYSTCCLHNREMKRHNNYIKLKKLYLSVMQWKKSIKLFLFISKFPVPFLSQTWATEVFLRPTACEYPPWSIWGREKAFHPSLSLSLSLHSPQVVWPVYDIHIHVYGIYQGTLQSCDWVDELPMKSICSLDPYTKTHTHTYIKVTFNLLLLL